jgi:hypothetical protein
MMSKVWFFEDEDFRWYVLIGDELFQVMADGDLKKVDLAYYPSWQTKFWVIFVGCAYPSRIISVIENFHRLRVGS